ncbi:MAG: hypothetical protein B7Z80_23825 [Rhodospirillales bacterium 20-64-7]|nr:MAG: hypothetical protein B7Z80_23825 [Rhodospirillales bacterium 20-64-7]
MADVFSLIGTNHIANARPTIYPDHDFDANDFLSKKFSYPKRPLLLLHFTSDEKCRSWPAAKAKALVEWILLNTNMNVLEFGLTPLLNESDRIYLPRSHLHLAQQMALIKIGNFFVGVDSGFSHLANAFGVPSIFLIGIYRDFSTHLPWHLSDQDRVLRSDRDAYNIPLDDVERAVELRIKELGLEK